MAKLENNRRGVGLRPNSVAVVSGISWATIGLAVAVLYSVSSTVNMAAQTKSVLAGLTFGLASGVVAIIVVPLVYFALGWVVGLIKGYLLNMIAEDNR